MSDDVLRRVISPYEPRGQIELVAGDAATTARARLGQATDELPGVEALINMGQARLAYRKVYDVWRNAAEVVVAHAGYRVTSALGHHDPE